jgi:hypothetical protein
LLDAGEFLLDDVTVTTGRPAPGRRQLIKNLRSTTPSLISSNVAHAGHPLAGTATRV